MTAVLVRSARPLTERSFDDLLAEAVEFHGHLCPGQVLGVRMALAGTREVGITTPRTAGSAAFAGAGAALPFSATLPGPGA